jgi:serine/threonine protein kinase
MLGFPEYMGALDEELHDKFLGVAKDSTGGLFDRANPANSIDPEDDKEVFEEAFYQFVDSLQQRYNDISDNISGGQIGQLQRWRQSLNLPWRTNEELCVASLSSPEVDAFRRLQCPSIVNLESLCRLQPEDVSKYDEDLCASFITETGNNLAVLIPSIVAPIVLLIGIGAYVYVERKKRIANRLWAIKQSELKFDVPPTAIGRGTFGQVFLAEYRGTQVAVKKVVPPRRDVTNEDPGIKSVATAKSDTSSFLVSSNGLQKFDKNAFAKSQIPEQAGSGSGRLTEEDNDDFIGDVCMPLNDEETGDNDCQVGLNDEETGDLDGDTQITLNDEAINLQLNDAARPRSGSFDGSSSFGNLSIDFSKSSAGELSVQKPGVLKSMMTFGRTNDEHAERRSDFIKEMQHLSKLRHPCITTVMGAVIEKGVEPMLVMEYCEHGSLYDLIHNESMTLDGDVLLPILRDICQGIRFLHAATPQIIHGDLKAVNILVDGRFRAKVADFGLSAKKSAGATGTPLWMAPELLRGEGENTPASDAYSFGIILYEVYSRKDPYEGEDYSEIVFQIAHPTINKRPPIPQGCPSSISTIMTECIDANAETRPTFEELDLRLKRLNMDSVTPQYSAFAAYSKQKRENKAETLLQNVFPPHIAAALREGRKVEKEHHECVTIFFSDIVGFTTISARIGPEKVADMLDRLYTKFDELTDKHEIYKIETIGDAYMAITNLVKKQNDDHVKRMVDFSRDAIHACKSTLIDEEDHTQGTVQIRVGFHSGPVLSGVVGIRLPKFGVFGDTVNTASRMEVRRLCFLPRRFYFVATSF